MTLQIQCTNAEMRTHEFLVGHAREGGVCRQLGHVPLVQLLHCVWITCVYFILFDVDVSVTVKKSSLSGPPTRLVYVRMCKTKTDYGPSVMA